MPAKTAAKKTSSKTVKSVSKPVLGRKVGFNWKIVSIIAVVFAAALGYLYVALSHAATPVSDHFYNISDDAGTVLVSNGTTGKLEKTLTLQPFTPIPECQGSGWKTKPYYQPMQSVSATNKLYIGSASCGGSGTKLNIAAIDTVTQGVTTNISVDAGYQMGLYANELKKQVYAVVESSAGTSERLIVIDATTDKVVKTVTLPQGMPTGVVINKDGSRAILSYTTPNNSGTHSLESYDTTTWQRVATSDLTYTPEINGTYVHSDPYITIPGSQYAYILVNGDPSPVADATGVKQRKRSLAKIDLDTLKIVGSIGTDYHVISAAASPDGKTIYALSDSCYYPTSCMKLISIDVTTFTSKVLSSDTRLQWVPNGLFVSADGKKLYLNNGGQYSSQVKVYDIATNTFSTTFSAGTPLMTYMTQGAVPATPTATPTTTVTATPTTTKTPTPTTVPTQTVAPGTPTPVVNPTPIPGSNPASKNSSGAAK